MAGDECGLESSLAATEAAAQAALRAAAMVTRELKQAKAARVGP